MASEERKEIRTIIQFCQQLGDTPTATYKKIIESKGKSSVSRSLVFNWHKRFSDGESDLKDRAGRGRKKIISSTLVTSIADALLKDRRLSVRTLAETFDLSKGTIHTILTKELLMRKVHARWVPRLLKDHEREKRVSDSRAFLRRVTREGDDFLGRIITTDETWLWFHDPETKSQSAVWKRHGSPPPKKARVCKSGGKYMFIMFADMHGMILQHAVPKDKTVNAEYFSKVLRRDLVDALRKKRPGLPIEHFILHMDNASSHTASTTQLEIGVLGFQRIDHPPYSPDLAPFDFSIFPTIKLQLKGKRFTSLKELVIATTNITRQYDREWYYNVYKQWVHRHHRCIEHEGRYFEKE